MFLLRFSAMLLLACILFVGSLSHAAADDQAAPLDRSLRSGLRDVINRGATVYNNGDPAGCCRLFEGALRTARPLLDHRPALQKAIEAGLQTAEQTAKMEDRAFALREVLDKVVADLGPAKPEAKKTAAVAKPREAGFVLSDDERTLLDLTNKERAKQNLPLLKPNEKLFQAARAHSANMAKQERLDHTLDGKGPAERLADLGYRHSGWGENCAAGQQTPAEAFKTWMNSDGHRANILNEPYAEIGIGVVAGANGTRYWTQVFGAPR